MTCGYASIITSFNQHNEYPVMSDIIHNQTPVCRIVNKLNARCVGAAKAGDFGEASRLAALAGAVEDAVTETGLVGDEWEAAPVADQREDER